ncbi:hypothetical protein RJ639_042935 [Escallonia herrerae]|uniref:WAT1-related protein n=1 Tax=Escallonia herrerae TaxID=1293975 RepID=A0AA89B9C8_9ASTE|nr:hypothetical protein RJ639_042935 [Escallonia herrerae]
MGGNNPYLAVILIQTIYAGMFLLSKAAFDVGMNTFIFVFYRQAAATIFLAPVAMIFEWRSAPSLSFTTLCKILMLSLCGITLSLNLYGVALTYTSATLAAATANCLPAITFFFAVLFRMESLKMKTIPGVAKVFGIAACLLGAATIAFYRGPCLTLLQHHHLFGHRSPQHPTHSPSKEAWVKGVFIMLLSNTCWGLWLVLQRAIRGHISLPLWAFHLHLVLINIQNRQARVMKSYPTKLLFTTLQCFLSSIQSLIIAIAMERNSFQWKLGWNVRLLAVAYCGVVVTGVTFYLQAWVIEKKGPLFIATSTPLSLIITIFCSVFLLGEIINLGSILGGILLVGGLYGVLWGKSEEHKIDGGIFPTGEADKACSESNETMTIKSSPSLLV